MTALGKLFRTTAFKLALAYLTMFVLFDACLLGYFAWNTSRIITGQIIETVGAEINGLAEQYSQGGIRRLVLIIEGRSRRPSSNLYLITTPAGEALAGNVGTLEPGLIDHPGLSETVYRRLDEAEGAEHNALVHVIQLPSGFRLLVGRDLEERERLHEIVIGAGKWSVAVVIVLGLLGGFVVARRVLGRIDAMSDKTRTIMDGDLAGRLADRRHRRRARPPGGQPQRDAGAHRGADARPQGSVRQHRPRPQDAADAAAQPLRGGAAQRPGRQGLPRRA